jgi:hypothetical protein
MKRNLVDRLSREFAMREVSKAQKQIGKVCAVTVTRVTDRLEEKY